MALRDFLALLLVCLAWAVHTIIAKVTVTDLAIPPLFYALARYGVVALVAARFILPLPRPLGRVAFVSLLMGAGSFAFFFAGIRTATPSSAAVVLQLSLPMTTILSVLLLGERIGWRRGLGILLAFAGVVTVMYDPAHFVVSPGLLLIAVSAFSGSLASVMMKRIEGISPMQYQAWVGLTSIPPLLLLTLLFEDNQIALALDGGLGFAGAVLFSALVVSILAHSIYYRLIMAHDANLIAPLMILSPLMTVALGLAVTGDPFDLRMAIGTVLALTGVLIIALRRNRVLPKETLTQDPWR